jgi:uroporphyrinogen-III synthase
VVLDYRAVALGRQMDIATFASPSAVRNWAARIGVDLPAVTIGPTTAEAAKKAGFKEVYCPDVGSRGVGPWAALVLRVASEIQLG